MQRVILNLTVVRLTFGYFDMILKLDVEWRLVLYKQGIHFSVDHSPRPNDDLCLLSNDIPIPSTNSSESLSDLDVEDTVIIGESKGI